VGEARASARASLPWNRCSSASILRKWRDATKGRDDAKVLLFVTSRRWDGVDRGQEVDRRLIAQNPIPLRAFVGHSLSPDPADVITSVESRR